MSTYVSLYGRHDSYSNEVSLTHCRAGVYSGRSPRAHQCSRRGSTDYEHPTAGAIKLCAQHNPGVETTQERNRREKAEAKATRTAHFHACRAARAAIVEAACAWVRETEDGLTAEVNPEQALRETVHILQELEASKP